jgi:uroporphyrinogen decarboxylase
MKMTNRERALAVLNYKPYDRLPIVHFGFWTEALQQWCREGHLKPEELNGCHDRSPAEEAIIKRLGFDFNWQPNYGVSAGLSPGFESKVIEELPDGSKKVLNGDGLIILQKEGAGSIPAEVGHLLKGRKEWEELYLPKLQFSEKRVHKAWFEAVKDDTGREIPLGLNCGSLFGSIRGWLGVPGLSYLYADDEELYTEIIDTVGNLAYKCNEAVLATGAKFDYANFWEDICFKNGPLVNPKVFDAKVGPHYKRITELFNKHGVHIVSLDCDGMIDALVPTWINNGVNTMFPIEVGTWDASIAPWREKYGKELRGVGGMNKNVFARDYAAVDAEIERLKPLVALGGYIPCPDHRIPLGAKWENIQYYCEQMRKAFG